MIHRVSGEVVPGLLDFMEKRAEVEAESWFLFGELAMNFEVADCSKEDSVRISAADRADSSVEEEGVVEDNN